MSDSENLETCKSNMEALGGDLPDMALKQMCLNFHWLLGQMDAAHNALCPTHIGTWQQRAEALVVAAKERGNQ